MACLSPSLPSYLLRFLIIFTSNFHISYFLAETFIIRYFHRTVCSLSRPTYVSSTCDIKLNLLTCRSHINMFNLASNTPLGFIHVQHRRQRVLESQEVWQFGGPPLQLPNKLHHNILCSYVNMVIPHCQIINFCQYSCNVHLGPNCKV